MTGAYLFSRMDQMSSKMRMIWAAMLFLLAPALVITARAQDDKPKDEKKEEKKEEKKDDKKDDKKEEKKGDK
jgi:ribosomal protein L12E/L44/L45/RPP1/RPP2